VLKNDILVHSHIYIHHW